MRREVILIDEEKCDGCGQCVPSCHEGALEIVNGKAKLVADILCDGLGACLGECPQGALKIERREAEAFDEKAVEAHLARKKTETGVPPVLAEITLPGGGGGCPSSRFVSIQSSAPSCDAVPNSEQSGPSELTHWPVQLRLLSPSAPVLQGASLLLSADCVPVAFPGFHQKLLRGRAVAVACPKLDDPRTHLAKLTEMIRRNDLEDITVAHMQVPCCSGLLALALEARRASGRSVHIVDLVIGTGGEVLARSEVPADTAVNGL